MRDSENDRSQERTAKNQQRSKDGYAKSQPGCVGTVSTESKGVGDESLGVGRNDSEWTDVLTWIGSGADGGIIGQLINELEGQLADYEKQVVVTRQRIEKLKSISETQYSENNE
ncbi:MAG TPA: hypothetical protein VK203_07825 [Nostocaceae cyanobacterium]|nr:hypothetical protein [Nostocaceae cyanobacterium]